MKPTDEQARWLWEQCGLTHDSPNSQGQVRWYDSKGNYIGWFFGCPPIDANNLFEYEPLTARGYHITTDTYKREVAGVMGQCSWAKIIDPWNGNIVSCFAMKELKDALFWAIFTALGGK